jgi:aminoglycoside phosphotransferase (APT) family kinase protein
MNGPTSDDSVVDSLALHRWLRVRLCADSLAIANATSPQSGGWSNETHIFDASWTRGGSIHARRLVLRLAPLGGAMFREYDLGRQVYCLRHLCERSVCPVPAVIADDLGGTVLSRPFYIMDFVDGDVPADDRPTFFEAGFLAEASIDAQRRFYDSCIDSIASIHHAPVDEALVSQLTRVTRGATALEREVHWLADLYEWGKGPAEQRILDRAFAWVLGNLPDDATATLLWGDARPANTVVRDFEVVALLDWELATLGPPELDVFWFLEMNRMRANGRSLPGFPSDAAALAGYEARTGRKIRDAEFHTLYAALKVAVLMLRYLRAAVERGQIPEHHAVLTDNTATRRLDELLT